jgi:hypothetical protein
VPLISTKGPRAPAPHAGATTRRFLRARRGSAHILTDLGAADPFERRDGGHRDPPFRQRRPDQPSACVISDRAARGGGEFAVRLVDEGEIGEIGDAVLDPLQLASRCRRQDEHEHVDHFCDGRFGRADADRLDQHRVKLGRLA